MKADLILQKAIFYHFLSRLLLLQIEVNCYSPTVLTLTKKFDGTLTFTLCDLDEFMASDVRPLHAFGDRFRGC